MKIRVGMMTMNSFGDDYGDDDYDNDSDNKNSSDYTKPQK